MLMTDLAVRDLEGRSDSVLARCRRLLIAVFGRSSNHHLPANIARRQAAPLRSVPRREAARPHPRMTVVAAGPAASPSTDGDLRWQRHPQLRARQAERAPMPGSQRSARLEAERAVILARGGKLPAALEAFTTAAGDPSIDLSALPGFWDLPRNGMMTAVRAYEAVDRLRDAAALEARIRHMLRPRALKPLPGPTEPGRLTASGD